MIVKCLGKEHIKMGISYDRETLVMIKARILVKSIYDFDDLHLWTQFTVWTVFHMPKFFASFTTKSAGCPSSFGGYPNWCFETDCDMT